jgi:hypothetical protein
VGKRVGGRGQGGEMTQAMYAYVNKLIIIKKRKENAKFTFNEQNS